MRKARVEALEFLATHGIALVAGFLLGALWFSV